MRPDGLHQAARDTRGHADWSRAGALASPLIRSDSSKYGHTHDIHKHTNTHMASTKEHSLFFSLIHTNTHKLSHQCISFILVRKERLPEPQVDVGLRCRTLEVQCTEPRERELFVSVLFFTWFYEFQGCMGQYYWFFWFSLLLFQTLLLLFALFAFLLLFAVVFLGLGLGLGMSIVEQSGSLG